MVDRAVVDVARADHARCDVYVPDFDLLVTKMERNLTKGIGNFDGAFADVGRTDYSRADVYIPTFEALVKKLEALT